MTTIEELTKRVSTLEDTVTHLTTHHDEQYVEIHDDMNAIDRCEQLFNVQLRNVRGRAKFKKAPVSRQQHDTHHGPTQYPRRKT
jgi:hypothetical protein